MGPKIITRLLLLTSLAHVDVQGTDGGGGTGRRLTWPHTEDLVEVGTDAHLLVELGGLGQVGTGLEVRHGEDVGSTFTGSWERTKGTTFRN